MVGMKCKYKKDTSVIIALAFKLTLTMDLKLEPKL